MGVGLAAGISQPFATDKEGDSMGCSDRNATLESDHQCGVNSLKLGNVDPVK